MLNVWYIYLRLLPKLPKCRQICHTLSIIDAPAASQRYSCLNSVSPEDEIPSQSLTWNLKMAPWNRRFLLETIIFRFQCKRNVRTLATYTSHEAKGTVGNPPKKDALKSWFATFPFNTKDFRCPSFRVFTFLKG